MHYAVILLHPQMTIDPELANLVIEASDAFAPSQSELAAEIGVRPLALTTWRRGRSRPTAEHLHALAAVLKARGERLLELAAQLDRRAASQGRLTRRPRRVTELDLAEMWAGRMVAAGEEGEVRRVVFYGSRARGKTRSSASDWDFMVVLDHEITDVEAEERRFRRAALEGPTPIGNASLDIWPISLSEWESARQLHGHPARAADREGVVVYAAD